jgi:predicted phosphodiesterase
MNKTTKMTFNDDKSFNVAFISDLHIDFYIKPKFDGKRLDDLMDKFIEDEMWLKNADILIIAGDNSHYPIQNKLMLEKIAAKKIYKKIFVTFGNHDMYLVSNSMRKKFATSWDKVMDLKKICDDIDTVEFLDGNIVEVDGVKIGGVGMWYDFSYGFEHYDITELQMMHKWKDAMTDPDLIVGKDRPSSINDSRYEAYAGYGGHGKFKIYTFDPIKFFKSEQEKLEKIIEDCDIFVSHIGPVVPPSLRDEYLDVTTAFYYFDGKKYLMSEKAPKLWTFGHTHDRHDFKVNNTHLVCNPLGYKSEAKNHEVAVVDLFNLEMFYS